MLWAGPPSRYTRGASTPTSSSATPTRGGVRDWFVVANLAPFFLVRTGHTPEYKACWEERPTTEEMAQVERLLKEMADLSAQGLMGAVVAISFCRRLTQPI